METIHDFYRRFSLTKDSSYSVPSTSFGHFNVFQRDACSFLTPYSRRDYYKISLVFRHRRTSLRQPLDTSRPPCFTVFKPDGALCMGN